MTNASNHLTLDHNFFEKLRDETLLAEIMRQVEENTDYFESIYPGVKKAWSITYILAAIFCVLLAKIAHFERSGEAGDHRTLVNQLMSFNIDQSCVYFLIPATLDTLRAFMGPLPRIMCQVSIFIKNLVCCNVALICLMMTATKFVILCYFKHIPVMEDNFLSAFLYMIINLISLLAVLANVYLPGKPTLNELICTGCFYDQWMDEIKPMPVYVWIFVSCFLIHLILSFPIWIAKNKMNKNEPRLTGVTLGSFLSSWIMLGLMFFGISSYITMNAVHPSNLNRFPINILVFNVHIFSPTFLAIAVCISLLYKNKSLRKSFGLELVEDNSIQNEV